MLRNFRLLACLVLLAPGCATCSRCFDEAYGYYGGITPRHDLFCGRVGSVFTPEVGGAAGTLQPTNTPPASQRTPASTPRIIEGDSPFGNPQTRPPETPLPEPDERPPAATRLESVLRGQ